jgi:type IX secretion system PorP/SprF family membrane protein
MKRFLLLIIMAVSISALAQDPEFSQYYAAPLYLNPAFAGTTDDHRFMANYRNQWPNVTQGYQTYAFSYDYNLAHYNSGVGFMVTTDKAGTAGLKSTELNFVYSYKFNIADKWVIATGLNFGYAFRSIDFNKLIFSDQLQFDANGNAPSDDPAAYNLSTAKYFDFNSGILAYNKTFWFGFAASHLNTPNRSLINDEAILPIKTTIHGGLRIPLYWGPFKKDRISVLSPSFVYKRQGKFDQLDIGAYFLYDPIVIGVWYRGIPIQQNVKDNISQDAVVIILGFNLAKVEFSYSYDFTVSELGPGSGGTHELALKYKMAIQTSSRHKRKQKFIPCPTFNRK